jgi:hypothetical protein
VKSEQELAASLQACQGRRRRRRGRRRGCGGREGRYERGDNFTL